MPEIESTSASLIGTRRVTIPLPTAVPLASVVIGASDAVVVHSRTERIGALSGAPAPTITNTGDQAVTLNNVTTSTNVTSVGPVVLAAGARVTGAVTSSGSVTLGAGASVTGGVKQNTSVPTQVHSWPVIFTPALKGDEIIGTGQVALTPGAYGTVSVARSARLKLSAGTYFFQFLTLDDSSNLDIDTTAGNVVVYVGSYLQYYAKTTVTGAKEKFLMAYLGTNRVVIAYGLAGTFVAPSTDVALAASGEGAIFARSVMIGPAVDLRHRPFSGWSTVLGTTDDCLRSEAMLAIGRNGYSTGIPVDPFRDDSTNRLFVTLGDAELRAEGHGWDEDVSAEAIAMGDVGSDGKDETVVGRSAHDGGRVQIFADRERDFRLLAELGREWGAGFGVSAIALGDIDNDGAMEIAVGRTGGGDQQLFLYDDEHASFTLLKSFSLNGRTVNDLEFADADLDGKLELLVALSGGSSKVGRVAVVEDPSQDYAVSRFADSWGAERGATAIAVGDMDGSGYPEIVVGRSPGPNERLQLWRFGGLSYQFAVEWSDWGEERAPSAIDFGDVDGDGDEELVVGRNGGCSSCDRDPRVFVFGEGATQTSAPVELAIMGEGWDEDRGTTAIAVADFDGDNRAEIAVGRSAGDNDRLLYFDDAQRGFVGIRPLGRGWGNDRRVESLAASNERICVSRKGKAMPSTVAEANAQFDARRDEAVLSVLKSMGPLLKIDLTRALGTWQDPAPGLRAIAAAYTALAAPLPPAGSARSTWTPLQVQADVLRAIRFANVANNWLANSAMTKDVGTNADFDFQLMTMAGLLYKFGNVMDPDPKRAGEYLLSDAAVMGLLLHNKVCPSGVPDLAPSMSGSTRRCAFPLASTAAAHNLMYMVVIPETENHVLMINTWSYLASQWLRQKPRKLPDEVLSFVDTYASSLRGAGSNVSDYLLRMTARVMTSDNWETNARAYQAYTVRALMLLASYAEAGAVKEGARNALDFLATKYAFQSHQGRRITPMRRNWKYKERAGITENDYVPAIFGILTGATLRDTNPSCVGVHCMYKEGQNVDFALDAALMSYRVPALIHDFMLQPDNRQPGFGVWSRMQARYTEEHYKLSQFPLYPTTVNFPDLSVVPLEAAPEFYFITKSFMNSAGGRYEEYGAFNDLDAVDTIADILEFFDVVDEDPLEGMKRGTDVVTKPTMLVAGGDLGYWRGPADAEPDVLLTRGSSREFWKSNNTGVYKNVALGYDTERKGSAFVLPIEWSIAQADKIGAARFSVVRASSTTRTFPNQDHFVVVVDLPTQPGAASLGLWEVVPRSKFASEAALLKSVIAANSGNGYSAGSTLVYTTVVSGERLTINRDYPASGYPFSAIDGSAALVSKNHVLDQSLNEKRNMPLLQASQVDARYQLTNEVYAFAPGDGTLRVRNPCLGQELVLTSSVYDQPSRTTQPIVGAVSRECMAARSGL